MEFTPAGSIDGIPLVGHYCPRYRHVMYVSAQPAGYPYQVPGCGCSPHPRSCGARHDTPELAVLCHAFHQT